MSNTEQRRRRKYRGSVRQAKLDIDNELATLDRRIHERWIAIDEAAAALERSMDECAAKHGTGSGEGSRTGGVHVASSSAASKIVTFNVGGRRMSARRKTLMRVEGSRLASIFGGRWDKVIPRDKAGRIFLDLDPDLFMKVVLVLQEEVEELVVDKNDEVHFERLVSYLRLREFVYGGGGDEGTGEATGDAAESNSPGGREHFFDDPMAEQLNSTKQGHSSDEDEDEDGNDEDDEDEEEDEEEDETAASKGAKEESLDAFRLSAAFQKVTRAAEREMQELEREEKRVLQQAKLFEEEKEFMLGMLGTSSGGGEGADEEPDEVLDEVLSLSANGSIMCTHRSTLCSVEGSSLASQFSSRWTVQEDDRDDDGNIFLEGSPYIFAQVLKWLRLRRLTRFIGGGGGGGGGGNDLNDRAPYLSVPRPVVKEEERAAFWRKVSYYGLTQEMRGNVLEAASPLLEQCSKGSRALLSWLPPIANATLIYSASRDGGAAADFHRQCDGCGHTLTVVRCGGYLFGGFASVAWATSKGVSTLSVLDPSAFLFSLEAEDGIRTPTRLDCVTFLDCPSVCHNPNYCAAFGGATGFDLYMSSSRKEPGRQSTYCTSTLGNAFEPPKGVSRTKFLAGKQSFRPDEWEVISLELAAPAAAAAAVAADGADAEEH